MIRVRTIVTTGFALALLAYGPVPGAAAQEPEAPDDELPTLAVLDLRDGGSVGPQAQDLSNLGTGIGMMLTTEMMRNPRVAMVERDEIKQIMQEQGLALSGAVDPSTAVEVGKLIGAQYMLFGTYTDVYGELRIDVRVVDVETGRLVQAQEITRKREKLFDSVQALAARLFDELELEPPEKLPEREEIPARAVLHFSQGVGFEDRGETERAKEMYRKALEIFPGYEEARERLENLGGTP